jgi:hypothetical protein
MKFKDIPQLTRSANYRVNQDWNYLIETIKRYSDKDLCPLDIDPDFQRGHVWTEQQQIAYVEFKLRGGSGSNELQFNCPGWMNDFRGPFVLVDGKQRLTAVMKFLNNELPIFDGQYFKDFEGSVSFNVDFVFHINDLSTMEDVYKWYIELNSGGTPHTKEELDKVKKMLKK